MADPVAGQSSPAAGPSSSAARESDNEVVVGHGSPLGKEESKKSLESRTVQGDCHDVFGITLDVHTSSLTGAASDGGGIETYANAIVRGRVGAASVISDQSEDNGGFVPVRKKGSAAAAGIRTRGQQSLRIVSRLKGAYRVDCTPFHLSNISLTSSVEDVITFCRLKRVTIIVG